MAWRWQQVSFPKGIYKVPFKKFTKEPQMFDEIELLRMYAQLPQSEREALDETIMDQGITDLVSMIQTVKLVTTYFKEQS